MKKQLINATPGLGPIVCITLSGSNPDMPGFDGNLQDEENPNLDDQDDMDIDPEIEPIEEEGILPEGEEQNVPDPDDIEDEGIDPDYTDIPMETPSRDNDAIGPDHEPQVNSSRNDNSGQGIL